jgi:NAD(P)-dependent dehydrogenase (short-subunit alcohol dehydrogenase family)
MANPPLALVTGANRGLGFETSRQLVARGYRVILTARRLDDAELAAKKLDHGRVEPHALDVMDSASVEALARATPRWGKLDALVNNAGTTLPGFDAEIAKQTLAANLWGAVSVTDALLPALADSARIVMVSSGMGELSVLGSALRRRFSDAELTRAGLRELTREFVDAVQSGAHQKQGWPSNAYRVSKVALNAFTRILARELGATSIRVNAVCPGWVRTRMGGTGAERSPEEGASGIVWAATLPPSGPSGGFFRDGERIEW